MNAPILPAPWGQANWLLHKIGLMRNATFIGCISAEDRCSAFLSTEIPNCCSEYKFIRIMHATHDREWTEVWNRKESKHADEISNQFSTSMVTSFNLFCRSQEMGDFCQSVTSEEVIIDITCMPKRFFFFIIKILSASQHIKRVLCLYASPKDYSGEQLAKSPENPMAIDGFGIETNDSPDKIIISVGFEPLGLSSYIESLPAYKISAILPFPTTAGMHRRNWTMLLDALSGKSAHLHHIKDTIARSVSKVHTCDAFGMYRMISFLNGQGTPILAPYGPKPHSLGMALYSINNNCPVFYTQPSLYNPNYSSGHANVYGYLIKENGITWK